MCGAISPHLALALRFEASLEQVTNPALPYWRSHRLDLPYSVFFPGGAGRFSIDRMGQNPWVLMGTRLFQLGVGSFAQLRNGHARVSFGHAIIADQKELRGLSAGLKCAESGLAGVQRGIWSVDLKCRVRATAISTKLPHERARPCTGSNLDHPRFARTHRDRVSVCLPAVSFARS